MRTSARRAFGSHPVLRPSRPGGAPRRSVRRPRGAERAAFLTAALLCLAVFGVGCEGSSPSTSSRISANVLNGDGEAVSEALVTLHVVDVDLPADLRVPLALEPRLTDSAGMVAWDYESAETPYVCGYRVTDAAGTRSLAALEPAVGRILSTPDGHLLITIP